MATKYIDVKNGNDGNVGSLASPWKSFNKFMNNTGSWGLAPGDICYVRRNTDGTVETSGTWATAVHGTALAPIKVIADDGTNWAADKSTLGQTATLVGGSESVTGSANWSGVAAGDVVWFGSDPQMYFVISVTTTTMVLSHPYKGASGTGVAVYRMGRCGIVGYVSYTLCTLNKNYWELHGLTIANSNAYGALVLDASYYSRLRNCKILGYSASIPPLYLQQASDCFVDHCIVNVAVMNAIAGMSNSMRCYLKDVTINLENRGLAPLASGGSANYGWWIENLWLQNCTADQALSGYVAFFRGVKFTSFTHKTIDHITTPNASSGIMGVEDWDEVMGQALYTWHDRIHSIFGTEASTAVVRDGGNPTSIKVTPSSTLPTGTKPQLVFETPIWADTSEKIYTLYVNLPSATFTAAPTADQLFIEAFHYTNTGVLRNSVVSVDVAAIDDTWDALHVHATPGQTGILYLRLFYKKGLESGKTNVFYVDPLVVVSSP